MHRWDVVSETLESVFEAGGLGLELLDFLQGLEESVAEEGGDQVMVEALMCVGQKCASPLGNRDAKFDEEAADGVDAGGAAGEVSGAKAVQSRDGLLIERFHGDRRDLLITCGFQDGSGVGPISLVANSVASNVGGREQGNLMAESPEFASPVVSRATGFHEHMARRSVEEEAAEAST